MVKLVGLPGIAAYEAFCCTVVLWIWMWVSDFRNYARPFSGPPSSAPIVLTKTLHKACHNLLDMNKGSRRCCIKHSRLPSLYRSYACLQCSADAFFQTDEVKTSRFYNSVSQALLLDLYCMAQATTFSSATGYHILVVYVGFLSVMAFFITTIRKCWHDHLFRVLHIKVSPSLGRSRK